MTIQLINKPTVQQSNKAAMLDEEVNCIRYIMKQKPSYVVQYVGNLEKGRQGILHKLASSILREDILNLNSNAIDLKRIGSVFAVNMAHGQSLSDEFFYQIQGYPIREDITYKVVEVENGTIVFPIKDEFAFQRIETTDEIIHINEHGLTTISLASHLLKMLFTNTQQLNLDAFIQELDNGTANMTLAYMYMDVWKEDIQTEASQLSTTGTFDYLLAKKKSNRDFSPSLFFEQLVLEGHHLHPGAKTKIGLTQKDVFKFSPEFHQTFDVRFVAVKKEYVKSTTDNPLLTVGFEEELARCKEELEQRDYVTDDYEIFPVHEWQFEQALPSIYAKEIAADQVILIKNVTMEAEATSSFRTVYPKKQHAPALKLAVNSQMTSTVRSISTQTALNSTRFTDMITSIMDIESQLYDFIPLNEIAGAAFKSEEELKSRNLTMLMRENVEDKLVEGELAIAGPALYAESPLTGRTILDELVNQYAETNNLTRNRAAFPFFEDYITTVIPGYLTLMVKYGIALEGHLQNSIPVFKDGRLTRFFFRDWGGARIYKERLRQQGIDLKFTPGSVSVTEDCSEMHNKLYYTVFQNHLGEIIRQLVHYSGIKEEEFWKRVKNVCESTLQSLAEHGGLDEQIAEDRAFLFQQIVMHKSLTKMRLSDGKGYCYSEVQNPLYAAEELND
ncbi:IucA/IucC family protein [Pseudalkalibacillus berkeleyi]|uniref:IucA/IucC family siderophore biosynthesis protein n=1 Tax=Pseudalkalibacillus berkeleyi TaxID=1069813 RepID=A0ABS9GUB3_9BACL|nr:IucA/IucC family protein [Pseudalkalibacillus berkeleyi]MCF6136429.1 IucA/IucC family siderophore biosynthesis protein [Pseudalkalibacillus berkeleyi]